MLYFNVGKHGERLRRQDMRINGYVRLQERVDLYFGAFGLALVVIGLPLYAQL